MPLSPGSEFAGFRIERMLGSGGMGAVYAARHPRLPRQVALKVLSESLGGEPAFRARFEREAELAARLDHPNVVSIFDRGVEGEQMWIAMQYIPGVDTDHLVKHRFNDLPPRRAVFIISEAAKGLDSAHRHGLLHRDVKPANILVAEDPDEGDKVYVADFGIARAQDQTDSLTGTSATPTTLPYASPEQIEGRQLDRRTDVYSLACTLYVLLTGSVPYPRASQLAVMNAHLTEPPPKVSVSNSSVPAAMDAVIARGMAKAPEDRYGSCRDLAAAAVAALAGGETVAGPAEPRRLDRNLASESTVASRATAPTIAPSMRTALPRANRASFLHANKRMLMIGASLLVVLAVAGGILVFRGDDDDSAVETSTSIVPSAEIGPWGTFEFVAEALPGLMPANPSVGGYQGVACAPVDKQLRESNDFETPVPIARIRCGPVNPVAGEFGYVVSCNRDRSPAPLSGETTELSDLRQEEWTRTSSSGTVAYGTAPAVNAGALFVSFNGVSRRFCQVGVKSGPGTTGQQVYDGWFRDAPL